MPHLVLKQNVPRDVPVLCLKQNVPRSVPVLCLKQNGAGTVPVLGLKQNGGRTMSLRTPNELSESDETQKRKRRNVCARVHEPNDRTH